MGTYLKIAPQDTAVTFTDINITNNVTSNVVNSSTASFGIATGVFSGSFIGSVTTNFHTPFFVTGSAGFLSYTDGGGIVLASTGSTPTNFFLIQDATSDIFKINSQGVVQTKTFSTGSAPTPQYGAFYFSNDNLYIGVET